jgi:two-component sensor histidine kinase
MAPIKYATIPVAFILNELITNEIEYAIPYTSEIHQSYLVKGAKIPVDGRQ